MGAFAFRTDPSIALRGIPPPFDPIQAFSRIANLRRLQQRGQINQQQLERMERERARLDDIRGIAAGAFEPGKGLNRAEFLQRLAPKHPLAALEFESQFAGQAREAAKDERLAQKSNLENASKIYELIGQLAGPGDALEKGGADPFTMQVAYADSLARLQAFGVDTSKLPQEYTPGLFARALVEAVTEKDRIDQDLRAAAIAERKAAREKKIPGVDVPFPPAVEAQKRRLARPTRPPARDIRNREALMIEATATDYLTEANGDPDEALALLEEELRLPNASAEFRRLASKIRNRIRERVRPGRSRRSTEGDRLQEILGPVQ